jgi:hypothetical protein
MKAHALSLIPVSILQSSVTIPADKSDTTFDLV